MQIHWQSQTEKEITGKLFDEERHRHFEELIQWSISI